MKNATSATPCAGATAKYTATTGPPRCSASGPPRSCRAWQSSESAKWEIRRRNQGREGPSFSKGAFPAFLVCGEKAGGAVFANALSPFPIKRIWIPRCWRAGGGKVSLLPAGRDGGGRRPPPGQEKVRPRPPEDRPRKGVFSWTGTPAACAVHSQ